jgi:hypothetical protein
VNRPRGPLDLQKLPLLLRTVLRLLAVSLVIGGTWDCSSPKRAATPAVPKEGQLGDTNQIINALLRDPPKTQTGGTRTLQATAAVKSPSPADSFVEDRERIKASVAQWDHGTGATLRFLKETTGESLSLIFVDETAPQFKTDAGMWMIQATARVSGGKIVGHFVLFLRDLRAGKYRGDDHTKEAVVAVLMGEPSWDGQNPETAWSVNRESWCEVHLRKQSAEGIEGDVRARLVDNKGTGYINIDSGYLFIKR